MKRFNFVEDNSQSTVDNDSINREPSFLAKLMVFMPFVVVLFLIYYLSVDEKPKNISLVDPNLQQSLSETIELYKKKKEYVDSLQTQIPQIEEEKTQLDSDIKTIEGFKKGNISIDLAGFLRTISQNIPISVALTKLSIVGNKIEISGIARDNDAILSFIDHLTKKGLVKLLNIKYSNYTDNFGPYKQDFLLEGNI